MTTINHLTMKELGEVYNEVFDHCFENVPVEHSEKIAGFWLNLVANRKPYLMVTEQGAATLTREVFGDAVYTDFVITLTSSFFMKWSPSDEEKDGLIKSIANSLSSNLGGLPKYSADYRAVPKRIEQTLSGPHDIASLLIANTWLLVLVLAPQFMTFRDLLPQEPQKVPRTQQHVQ